VDFSHYSDETVQTAVDLVNTYEEYAEIEHLATPADLEAFLATHGGAFCPPDFAINERDLHEVRALRTRLHDVFTSPNEAAAADALNDILSDVVATPRVSVHGASPHLHFEPVKATPARWLGSVTAMALSVALIDGGIERFGVCGSSTCGDVFVDTSRNRSRRHCSDTCTTRENVAAYRERKAASAQ
jgi:predicted RNA-binding Zn ribbon-like protein